MIISYFIQPKLKKKSFMRRKFTSTDSRSFHPITKKIFVLLYLFESLCGNGNLLSRQISKSKFIDQLNIFVDWEIYFSNKLPNQIKNINSVKKIKIDLDDFRNNGKENKLRRHSREPSKELLDKISLVNRLY